MEAKAGHEGVVDGLQRFGVGVDEGRGHAGCVVKDLDPRRLESAVSLGVSGGEVEA